MIFSDFSQKQLRKMRIDPVGYSNYLVKNCQPIEKLYEKLILELWPSIHENNQLSSVCETFSRDTELFATFYEKHQCSQEKSQPHDLQELFNMLSWYASGGVLQLFIHRSPELGAPEVRIKKKDLTLSDIENNEVSELPQRQIIYRGLSQEEHKTGQYRQSWTLDEKVANNFAKESYQKNGVVVRTTIDRDNIIYYKKWMNGQESEVIIKYGSICKTDVEIITG